MHQILKQAETMSEFSFTSQYVRESLNCLTHRRTVVRITVFSNMTPCTLANTYQQVGAMYVQIYTGSDVFPTVHHSIRYFLEPTLMHTSI